MFHHARLCIALLIASLACLHVGGGTAAAQDSQTLDLRPIWKEGQTARYRLTQTQTTRAEMQGVESLEPQQSVTEFRGEMTWRVVQPSDAGGGTVELTVDELEMSVTGPDGTQRSASGSRADEGMEPVQQWLGAMVGTPITFEVAADGEIASVAGWQAIRSAAGEEMGDGMNERYFRNLGRDMAAVVGATDGLRVGSSWQASSSSGHQFGEVASQATYEVVGVEEPAGVPTVTIERSASLELTPELPELGPNGPDVEFQQRGGEGSGFIIFDLSRHEIAGYYNTQTLAAEVRFILPDRQMSQSMTETTQTEVLRISEE